MKHDPFIANVARNHSRAMLRREAPFSHAGLTERGEEIARSVPFMRIAENIYRMQPASSFTPWRIVAGWLRSDPHRVEIEGCFDSTGVGIAMNDEEAYVTQIFVLSRPRMQDGVRHSREPCR